MYLTRFVLLGLAVLYLALAADAAEPEGWNGFYARKAPAPAPPQSFTDVGICLPAILEAQDRYNIPDNLLVAIGIQEAGRNFDGQLMIWPWTANSNGEGAFFESKAALEAWVEEIQAAGKRSIDVGCMQINQRWHAQHFASLQEATDPLENVDYAARFLLQLYTETGDWWEAAGRYHSSTPTFKNIYLKKLAQNQRLANAKLAALAVQLDTARTVPSAPSPAFHWSSDMTAGGPDQIAQALSIYSASPLQPILPGYTEAN